MRQGRAMLASILLATVTVTGAVLADIPLGPTHLVIGDANARVWHYKADSNDPASADKSTSIFNPVTPVVLNDLKVGDVVRFSIGGLTHGFTPVEGNATKKLSLVVRCGDEPKGAANNGAVLQELDCVAGQPSKVDLKMTNKDVRLQVLPTFVNPMEFICTQHGPNMRGRLELKK